MDEDFSSPVRKQVLMRRAQVEKLVRLALKEELWYFLVKLWRIFFFFNFVKPFSFFYVWLYFMAKGSSGPVGLSPDIKTVPLYIIGRYCRVFPSPPYIDWEIPKKLTLVNDYNFYMKVKGLFNYRPQYAVLMDFFQKTRLYPKYFRLNT